VKSIPSALIDEFLSSLTGYMSKDIEDGLGVLTQELIHSRIGAQFIHQDRDDEDMWVAYEMMIPAMLTALGRLHQRVNMLEKLVEPKSRSGHAC